MDSAPLIKARDHARAASIANHDRSVGTVALNEHVLAAGEFAKAAESTSSLEALRTLNLLEQEHRQLIERLRAFNSRNVVEAHAEVESPAATADEKAPISAADQTKDVKRSKTEQPVPAAPSRAATSSPPTLPQNPRRTNRDLSSSIASNLASARGIRTRYRGQAVSPSLSNEQGHGALEARPRREGSGGHSVLDQAGGKPSWVPPQHQSGRPQRMDGSRHVSRESSRTAEETSAAAGSESEEGFSRFYNTFGTILNRLSAPLAFAGLPLITEESTTEDSSQATPTADKGVEQPPAASSRRPSSRRKSPHRSSADPDLSAIFSKATLRAISRDAHGPADSFYVVPTTGHTVSYANILNWEQKERRRQAGDNPADTSNLDDLLEDDDDFVDARETPLPAHLMRAPSSLVGNAVHPGVRARLSSAKTERDVQNVVEELCMENASLKDMLDKVSKRLHAFEVNSQSSGLALAQSLRLNRPGSPLSNSGDAAAAGGGLRGGGGGGGAAAAADEAALRRKNLELEDQLAAAAKQMEALERDYGRSQVTLEKYRDKWEKLKAGARARRESTQGEPVEGSKVRK